MTSDEPPTSFAQQYEQYQALRSGRSVAELAGWSSIAVTGVDRHAFLHNFCTNDVKRLTPGDSCEAFFTNVKGKIVGHGLIDCRDTELAIIGEPGQAARLSAHLDRYIIREDVTLRDTTDERTYLLVTGGPLNQGRLVSMPWPLFGRADAKLYDIAAAEAPIAIHEALAQGSALVGQQALEMARIEAGTPWFGVDFNEDNLPQEVGRDLQAISFNKGCYLGQETVARIDALGHVNQQLTGVRFFGSDVPQPGAKLLRDGRAVGTVTSAAYSPTLDTLLALAMIRREAHAVGTRLTSPAGDCEVVQLPAMSEGAREAT